MFMKHKQYFFTVELVWKVFLFAAAAGFTFGHKRIVANPP
jgi:hypothetical protein